MKPVRRARAQIAKYVGLVLEELRDAWAIAAAELAGLVAYVFGAPLSVSALSAGCVLGVRVAAGLWLPAEQDAVLEPRLTDDQAFVGNLTVDGYTAQAIALRMGRNVTEIRALRSAVYVAAGTRNPNRLREWLRAGGYRPRASIVRVLAQSDWVRATAAIISMYSGYRTILCPLLHSIWPEIQCP